MGGWSGQTFVVKNSTFVVKDQNFPDFCTGFVRFLSTLDSSFRMEMVFFSRLRRGKPPTRPPNVLPNKVNGLDSDDQSNLHSWERRDDECAIAKPRLERFNLVRPRKGVPSDESNLAVVEGPNN